THAYRLAAMATKRSSFTGPTAGRVLVLAHIALDPLCRQHEATLFEIDPDYVRAGDADPPVGAEAHTRHLGEAEVVEFFATQNQIFSRNFATRLPKSCDEQFGGA